MSAPDEYVGKTVANKYRVEVMLGEGGMGKVYKAVQVNLDKPVVLKVLRQALLGDERTVARFQREAKAASRLNHPNSISVLDFGQADDGAMYIAMEYVQGKDLHAVLSREWPLPEARVVRIITQVLSALADAHSAGVVHRDLKPENIMVEQRRNEADFVKVLDFGIAKIVDGTDDEGPALTRAGFVCGTPEYMSPEQARGAKLDHRSDLYAVGVILYQLTSGLLPFDSESAVGFATKHLTEIPVPPTQRRPEAKISPSMERLIMKALAKNPDDRPQTAEEFRSELLAVEKERRAGGSVRSRVGTSAPLLPPVRKVTPVDQQETKVNTNPGGHAHAQHANRSASPWAAKEDTVVSEPRGAGPQPTETATATGTSPNRRAPGEGGSALAFKLATVVLVLLALALAGAYLFQMFNQPKEVFVPPGGQGAEHADDFKGPTWELEVALLNRRPGDALRLASDGDAAWHTGNSEVAIAKYLEAWRADQQPETALKLGELYFQQDRLAEAKGFWSRFQKDRPDSRANSYIDRMMPK